MSDIFYEIAPSSRFFHGTEPLVYFSKEELMIGQIVQLKLRGKNAYGFVVKKTHKPTFTSLELTKTKYVLPERSVSMFNWMREYYPAPLGSISCLFLPMNYAEKEKNDYSIDTKISSAKQKLSNNQNKVLKQILKGHSTTYLLHGETSSGKTRVYIELAKTFFSQNKSVLILVPEIGLSPQISNEFIKIFGKSVITYHSGLTKKQKDEIWSELLFTATPKIIIGPRSALFLPTKKLGLIVIDEFHDGAYKQESSPYYNALRVASKIVQFDSAKLILGSATPSISEYAWAKQKEIPILSMPALASSSQDSIETISVNLADKSERTKDPLLSVTLINNINIALKKNAQILLFLNKRGSSRAIICQDCGWRVKCENCDLPLTFHHDAYQLVCHTCGFHQKPPVSCAVCTSTNIIFKSPGTKSIASSLSKLFPSARIARFDKDNLKKEKISARHEDIVKGNIDILVGTQILSKGHDLPKLGLVGILQSESSLNFPDYTANEKSYQIIHQLIGRVGRSKNKGTVIAQSYTPENALLSLAFKRNWHEFYETELKYRERFDFPPYYHILKITASRASAERSKKALENFIGSIKIQKIHISGPAPCFIERKLNKHYWQVIIKSKNRSNLVSILKVLPKNLIGDIDPAHLL